MFNKHGRYEFANGEWWNSLSPMERAFLASATEFDSGGLNDSAYATPSKLGMEKLVAVFGDSIRIVDECYGWDVVIVDMEKYMKIVHEKVFG